MELIANAKTYETILFLKLVNQKRNYLISLFVYINTVIDNENNYKDFFIGA